MARTATRVDPGRAVYWNDLGRALELVPDLAGARAAYRQATSRSPYTPAFWWNLGRMEQEFVRQNEPGSKVYTAWQQKDDPTKFVHLFEFADQAAHETHGGSDAVRKFEAVYQPELVGGPVVFTDYTVVASNVGG